GAPGGRVDRRPVRARRRTAPRRSAGRWAGIRRGGRRAWPRARAPEVAPGDDVRRRRRTQDRREGGRDNRLDRPASRFQRTANGIRAVMTIRAYVVDDETLAVKRLTRLLEATGRVEVVGSATDPEAALAFLQRNGIDVLFLDVQMPGLSGFELLERLSSDPLVVF